MIYLLYSIFRILSIRNIHFLEYQVQIKQCCHNYTNLSLAIFDLVEQLFVTLLL
nr:MAG TPA: hypothetical protein [Caudoviricetes sp.]